MGASDLTQAGTKRRRVRNACEQCRLDKAKCSGSQSWGRACTRCTSRGITCVSGAADTAQALQRNTQPPPPPGLPSTSLPTPGAEQSESSASASGVVPVAPSVPETSPGYAERQLMTTYFEHYDPTTFRFLHAATTLRDWGQGKLDPSLQKAICAFGLLWLDASDQAHATATSWISQAQGFILGRLNRFSLPRLQALVLVISFRLRSTQAVQAWNLLGLAARLAFTLRLNHERTDLDPILQESRRRTMWAIYATDRRLCGGLRDISVVAVERVSRLRLPCLEHTFERGMPSRSQYIDPGANDGHEATDMDIAAYMIRFYEIRDGILGYTKAVLADHVCPTERREQFERFERDLDAFPKSLPPDLQLSSERLQLMAYSQDAPGYFLLHAAWLQSYLDLYRILVPGIREALDPEVLAATPADFTLHCQQRALFRAVQMVDMWHLVSRLGGDESVDEFFFTICVSQAAQILHNLGPMAECIPGGLQGLQAKLRVVLRLASSRLFTRIPLMGECLAVTRRLIERLGQPGVCPSPGDDMPMRQQNHSHMASKGSYIPQEQDLEDDNDEDSKPAVGEGVEQAPAQAWQRPEPLLVAGDTRPVAAPAPALDASASLYPGAGAVNMFPLLDAMGPQMADGFTGEMGDYGFMLNMFSMS